MKGEIVLMNFVEFCFSVKGELVNFQLNANRKRVVIYFFIIIQGTTNI